MLGIWWRGLTARGAGAGLVVGGLLSGGAVTATMFGVTAAGWWGALLAQPAAWTVPMSFATMIGVSLADRARVPATVARTMVRLHTPEQLDVDRGSYDPERSTEARRRRSRVRLPRPTARRTDRPLTAATDDRTAQV